MINIRSREPGKPKVRKTEKTVNRMAAFFSNSEWKDLPAIQIISKTYSRKKTSSKVKGVSSRKIKAKEIAIFTRQLAATLSSGLLLTEALDTIADELEDNFQDIVRHLIEDIRGGANFSEALSKYPQAFNVTYRSIIEAGEATGGLDKVLTKLAQYLESSEKIKSKVFTALTYPLFLFGFSCVVVIGVVVFIIPKFEEMFKSSGVALPVMTQIIIGVSHFIFAYGFFLIIAAVVLLWAFIFSLRNYAVRYVFDGLLLKVPVFGTGILHKFLVSRYCSTMAMLLGGGVALPQSLKITSRVVNHLVMQKAIEKVRLKVVGGAMIADVMRSQTVFPKLSVKMIMVGEKTGRLPEMLRRTAEYYDEELDNLIQKLSVLIEPAMIVVVGIFIGFIVVSLYLPIFNVMKLVK